MSLHFRTLKYNFYLCQRLTSWRNSQFKTVRKFSLSNSQGRYGDWIYSPEVSEALNAKKPVVALESTIICHGMPYPQNFETALTVENIVRENGSIPATIAILDGKINVGLTSSGLEKLAKMGQQAVKVSRRDLALTISQGLTGATTVAGTMAIAHRAGIKIFVTGGIGGVHRDGENTMDVSADLTELGRTPVTVVCAGVKSILDIEKTLEYLETQGVTVATFGDSADFPAFFTPKSGFKSPSNLPTIRECAALINANTNLELNSGILIAVPIPENEAAEAKEVHNAIESSLKGIANKGIRGKDITPYLLKRVNDITRGRSLKSNIALIKNNAMVGSQIAKCLAELGYSSKNMKEELIEKADSSSLLIIGGSSMDITSTLNPIESKNHSFYHTSSPGFVKQSAGGVGRNIAETAHKLSANPLLISAVGNDLAGCWLIENMKKIGMDTKGIEVVENQKTAIYNAINDPYGQLVCAVADMNIFDSISSENVTKFIESNKPKLVCFDGNISVECMKTILDICDKNKISTFFEPTSVPKSFKILKDQLLFSKLLTTHALTYITPNIYELKAMYYEAEKYGYFNFDNHLWFQKLDELNIGQKFRTDVERIITKHPKLLFLQNDGILVQVVNFLPYLPNIIVKLGENGILMAQALDELKSNFETKQDNKIEFVIPKRQKKGGTRFRYFEPILLDPQKHINSSGAGDSFVGALISGLMLHSDSNIDKVIDIAQKVAVMTLQSHNSVSEHINSDLLNL
ncbi:1306_t:CDS:10 [Cetraspora pellucida]|uniref:1306_t:CDS:1 n=1 Tax=Cetraspora pellucida TaxID=1433469 RepID=A0A9N9AIB9_9GLOM|nr:1306_t:CDS:10 [Cetraspora pellucida]